MRACITIDVEQDCPPWLISYRGIEEGMPRLLGMLAEERVAATFFCTGDVARRHPEIVRSIFAQRHELGCHGDSHRSFAEMNTEEARSEIRASTELLSRFAPLTSFRAPYLRFPNRHLPLLIQHGYRLDSSQARHKTPWARAGRNGLLWRIPASTTSSVIRLPPWIRNSLFRLLPEPLVLFVHPWEFVDFRSSDLRWDCRFRTGDQALASLRSTVRWLRGRGFELKTMRELTGDLR